MREKGFIFICGVIFYLCVILNYPILDILINPAKAANDRTIDLKCDDLFLTSAIRTHQWKITPLKNQSEKSKSVKSPQKTNPTLPQKKKPFITHIVKPGDTLCKISNKYNVSSGTICKLNNLKTNSILSIGMELKIENRS
ncbi:MAG: LysM peptidoglycan-binding domain-containing protein [bacterium]